MDAFLKTWYGLTLFIAFDAAAILLISAIMYRLIFKRFWEFVISAVCIILLSPLYGIIFIRGKLFFKRAGVSERFISREFAVGKKAKTIVLHSFRTRDKEGYVLGKYGAWLEKSGFYKLPRLWDVFAGKLSFTGVKALSFSDAAFIEESEEERYAVRPGLINPLLLTGDDDTDYKEMFASDCKYARKMSLTGDWKIFFRFLLKNIRGEKKNHYGKTAEKSYAEFLLEEGSITREDYDVVTENARAEEAELLLKYEPLVPSPSDSETESDSADTDTSTDEGANADTDEGMNTDEQTRT